MLFSTKNARNTATVGPEDNKSIPQKKKFINALYLNPATVTSYLQRKISVMHAKRMWTHFVSLHKTINNTSTVLFDSNEHLDTWAVPDMPTTRKSETMPNLSLYTEKETAFIHDTLPTAHSINSFDSQNSKKSSITRAKSWVGTSMHRWLHNKEDIEEKRRVSELMYHFELDEEDLES